MTSTHKAPDIGIVLLSFYECLTDPGQLDSLMEMLTSWLDDEDGDVVAPKLDYHADRAWRLLGEISETEYHASDWQEAHEQTSFETDLELEAAMRHQLRPEDFKKLKEWLSSEADIDALLLRVFEAQSTELVILSRETKTGAYLSKRTGPEFQACLLYTSPSPRDS